MPQVICTWSVVPPECFLLRSPLSHSSGNHSEGLGLTAWDRVLSRSYMAQVVFTWILALTCRPLQPSPQASSWPPLWRRTLAWRPLCAWRWSRSVCRASGMSLNSVRCLASLHSNDAI